MASKWLDDQWWRKQAQKRNEINDANDEKAMY